MGELGEKLRGPLEPALEPGETLRGACVATQTSLFKGRQVAIGVTNGRLIVQGMNRRFAPDGGPISLPPERIADASAEGTGPLGGLGGGEDQRSGVEALGAWFAGQAQR